VKRGKGKREKGKNYYQFPFEEAGLFHPLKDVKLQASSG